MGSEFVDWKALPFVIPAQAGIQVFFSLPTKPKMDAGLRRHDKSSFRLRGGTSTIPKRDIRRVLKKAEILR